MVCICAGMRSASSSNRQLGFHCVALDNSNQDRFMRAISSARLKSALKMTSHHSQQPAKLIFAPAGSSSNSQADQYSKGALEHSQLVSDPLTQFHDWFSYAQANSVYQPETVCLSTASLPSGRVSSRFVYLKELDSRGFVIYSNWGTSQKAKDVETNQWASLAFWWRELERQVRVEGLVERLTNEESQIYFDTRIRGSRIGAWASMQSEAIEGREVLERWVQEVEEKFIGQEKIPIPDFWGGVRIIPDRVEFWQGRENRLHDRFTYNRKDGEEGWKISRLSP